MLLRTIRDIVLPKGLTPRTLRFGLAKGETMLIDFQYDTAFFFGTYESELNPFILSAITQRTRCFDVGGYRGWDAVIFSKLSHEKVISFESNRDNVAFMERSFQYSGRDITVINKYVTQEIKGPNEITLDRASEEYFVPDFIKIDVEGAEAMVLRGSQHILSERKPSLLIEVHGADVERECIEILHGFGYTPTIIEGKKRLGRESRGEIHNRWLACEGD